MAGLPHFGFFELASACWRLKESRCFCFSKKGEGGLSFMEVRPVILRLLFKSRLVVGEGRVFKYLVAEEPGAVVLYHCLHLLRARLDGGLHLEAAGPRVGSVP